MQDQKSTARTDLAATEQPTQNKETVVFPSSQEATTEEQKAPAASETPSATQENAGDEEMQQIKNTEKLLQELLKSLEQGEPTEMVQTLLTELSSTFQLNLGPSIASHLLGSPTANGTDLINKVLQDPQLMWKKAFFQEISRLSSDQHSIVHNWFTQMVELQTAYIREIEKANDYLKAMVGQSFEKLNTDESLMKEFLAKIDHIENRSYFHRKRLAIERASERGEVPTHASRAQQSAPSSGAEAEHRARNWCHSSNVRLPHNFRIGRMHNMTTASVAESRSRVEKSVDFKLVEDEAVLYSSGAKTAKPLGNKEDLAELKAKFEADSPAWNEQAAPRVTSQEQRESEDADLTVDGCGKFYDRISMGDYNKKDAQPHPKSILRNKQSKFKPAAPAYEDRRQNNRNGFGSHQYRDYRASYMGHQQQPRAQGDNYQQKGRHEEIYERYYDGNGYQGDYAPQVAYRRDRQAARNRPYRMVVEYHPQPGYWQRDYSQPQRVYPRYPTVYR